MKRSGNFKSGLARFVFLLAIFFLSFSGIANASISWTKTYTGPILDRVMVIQPTTDGGYITAGYTYSGAKRDALVMKLDAAGNILWQKAYGGTVIGELVNYIQQTSDGGYIVLGYDSMSGFTLILKLTSEGNVQWQKTANFGTNGTGTILQTKDGGYILAGSNNYMGITVLKLDGDGNIQWQKRYYDNGYEYAHSIKESPGGGYLLASKKYLIGVGYVTWILKLDSDGVVKWQKIIEGSLTGNITSMQPTADGGCIVSGESDDLYQNIYYNWVFKLDANGTIQWQKKLNNGSRGGSLVLITPDDGFLLGIRDTQFLLVKFDKDGNKQWVRGNFGSGGALESFQNTPDGGLIVATSAYPVTQILKLDSSVTPSSGCGFGSIADLAVTDLDFLIRDTFIIPRQNNLSIWDSSVTVKDSALTTQSICMSAQPAISVNPALLDYSAIKLGNSSTKTVTILNSGAADLTISGAAISGSNASEFKLTSSCAKIASNGSCAVTIDFTPVSAGVKAAALSVASDDPKRATVIVPISATATVPSIAVSTTALNFPSVELPTSSANFVTVTNVGTAELNVNSFAVLGINAGEFKIVTNCSSVAPGSSCIVDVNFAPTSLGIRNAILTIISDDPAKPEVNISIAGKGVDTIVPSSSASLSGTKGNNDWFVTDVAVSVSATDSGSGVKEIRYTLDNNIEQVISGAAAGFRISGNGFHTVTYRAIDNANNEVSNSITFKIDSLAPVITGAALTQPNANGWYNGNVTAHFSATDTNSGIASLTPDTLVANEGAGQSVSGTAVDMAGNQSSYSVIGINVDKTSPVVTITGVTNGAIYKRKHVPTASYTAIDGISGVATSSGNLTGGDKHGRGQFTYTVTATDKAGNTATTSVAYTVKHDEHDEYAEHDEHDGHAED